MQVDESENDTCALLKSLSTVQTEQDTTKVFNGIHGPWSMIFYQVYIRITVLAHY